MVPYLPQVEDQESYTAQGDCFVQTTTIGDIKNSRYI